MKTEEEIRALISQFTQTRDEWLGKMKEHDYILGRRREVYWDALTGYMEAAHKVNALKWTIGEKVDKIEAYNRYWASRKQ